MASRGICKRSAAGRLSHDPFQQIRKIRFRAVRVASAHISRPSASRCGICVPSERARPLLAIQPLSATTQRRVRVHGGMRDGLPLRAVVHGRRVFHVAHRGGVRRLLYRGTLGLLRRLVRRREVSRTLSRVSGSSVLHVLKPIVPKPARRRGLSVPRRDLNPHVVALGGF
jgi:hypothetical protein